MAHHQTYTCCYFPNINLYRLLYNAPLNITYSYISRAIYYEVTRNKTFTDSLYSSLKKHANAKGTEKQLLTVLFWYVDIFHVENETGLTWYICANAKGIEKQLLTVLFWYVDIFHLTWACVDCSTACATLLRPTMYRRSNKDSVLQHDRKSQRQLTLIQYHVHSIWLCRMNPLSPSDSNIDHSQHCFRLRLGIETDSEWHGFHFIHYFDPDYWWQKGYLRYRLIHLAFSDGSAE